MANNTGSLLPPLSAGAGIMPIATMAPHNAMLAMASLPTTPIMDHIPLARSARPPPPPLDSMRAYRACLNCRNRKSKCDLELNQGRPPCRRCQREAKDCVLGESHRGGRRVRKKPKLEEDAKSEDHRPTTLGFQGAASSNPPTPSTLTYPAPAEPTTTYPPLSNPHTPHGSQPFQNPYTGRTEQPFAWPGHPTPVATIMPSSSTQPDQLSHPSSLIDPQLRIRQDSTISMTGKPGERSGVHENIATADLQNPSDALDILAQVADRHDDGDSSPSDQSQGRAVQQRPRPTTSRQDPVPLNSDDQFDYKPIQDGIMSVEMVYQLFQCYEEFCHPFFPIIPRASFERKRLPWMSRNEPHLFSAILTVASKDNERIFQICYDHNQQLVFEILAGADANVEAVEALLLLSQWVSHRPQASLTVGRGEEDRVAWMYIGTALRLGYFLGIDRTSFKSDSHEDPAIFNRKRLVWSACYICDRQVSVRIGKGFWARGPGPLSGLTSSDFPTLQPLTVKTVPDNWGLIFEANLELTQIFSNVHDILYSSKGHGWKEMLEGRYAKYLDDFRSAIRSWHDKWSSLDCPGRLKTSLMLTYDYLRLYVNAFAYQATISRAITFQRDSQHPRNRPMPLINASAPDARFIYEALDAAKSLMTNFNNFVEPETLRYMPSSYYLYIIYSAVFLYKARSTTTMTVEERADVRHSIDQTIERLQKASAGANQMGTRYARLIQMLWRKAPKRQRPAQKSSGMDGRINNQNFAVPNSMLQPVFNPNGQFPVPMQMNSGMINGQFVPQPASSTNFSWMNLDAAWNYAQENNGTGSEGDVDGSLMLENGLSPYEVGDMGLIGDYSLLDGDNPNLIF